jgi:serine/threonine protein kinase
MTLFEDGATSMSNRPHSPNDSEFRGTERFSVLRRLGAGAFGSVYEVKDRELQASVALKLLTELTPEAVLRFKQEFRSLVKLRHSNLVRLHELFCEDSRWFFTMELVEGQDFLQYLRPEGHPCNSTSLRATFSQFIAGVEALHKSGFLHCDLKPGNVLVDSSGRVVILDFGFVRRLNSPHWDESARLVGTPEYMSPEQYINKDVTEASDWYAAGVMMFQALTGKLPHPESGPTAWYAKTGPLEQQPRDIDPAIPEDLNLICCRLINSVPAKRPDGAELAKLFPVPPNQKNSITIDSKSPDYFVGRLDSLKALTAAFDENRQGNNRVVLIAGRSGIGKSALVRQFLSQISASHPNLLTFQGTCYEFETVPYKGVDTLIDQLGQFLQRLPAKEIEELLPPDASLLPKLFPVLGRIDLIANPQVPPTAVPDQQELRHRTFAALRELIARVAKQRPVVIWIDDLQWGDRDTISLLTDLCTPPQSPMMLLILSYRDEQLDSNRTLQYLQQMLLVSPVVSANTRQLILETLTPDQSRELLKELLGTDSREGFVDTILSEARGHPLFLHLLAGDAGVLGRSPSSKNMDLTTVVDRRIQSLPLLSREMAELISLAVQPLTLPMLFAMVSEKNSEERSHCLDLLIEKKIVRLSEIAERRRVEPFHDQIREAVAKLMSSDQRRVRHATLANSLNSQPDVEPQVLVKHYLESGNTSGAYAAAIEGARVAEQQLAFDRAAAFYQAAIGMEALPQVERSRIQELLGDALSKAGRGRDAAYAYLEAARSVGKTEQIELSRLAADQLMRAGYVVEGLKTMNELSDSVGVRIIRKRKTLLAQILLYRVRTRFRLLRGVPQPLSTPDPNGLRRLEVLRTGAVILNIADPVLAAYFQVQHIYEAFRVRDPKHLALAVGLEAAVRAATGTRNPQSSFALLAQAEQRANTIGDPNLIGYVYLFRSYVDYLLGLVPQGREDSLRAIAFLRDHCRGVAWELTAGYVLLFWFSCWGGRVAEVKSLLPSLLKEGAARGDVNVEVSLRLLSYVHYAYLSADQPDDCLAECKNALDRWPKEDFHLQHYGALFVQAETFLYLGRYDEAFQTLLASWNKMSKSFILRWQILTLMALFLRGRVALACWLDDKSEHLRTDVVKQIRKLGKVSSDWSLPMANVLRAGLLAGGGRRVEASNLLEMASSQFGNIGLRAYSAAALHVCGALAGGMVGREKIDSASTFMKLEEVRCPDKFIRMLLPGNWNS